MSEKKGVPVVAVHEKDLIVAHITASGRYRCLDHQYLKEVAEGLGLDPNSTDRINEGNLKLLEHLRWKHGNEVGMIAIEYIDVMAALRSDRYKMMAIYWSDFADFLASVKDSYPCELTDIDKMNRAMRDYIQSDPQLDEGLEITQEQHTFLLFLLWDGMGSLVRGEYAPLSRKWFNSPDIRALLINEESAYSSHHSLHQVDFMEGKVILCASEVSLNARGLS